MENRMLPSLQIKQARLMADIEKLAEFSDAPPPAITRILFTPTDLAARAFIRQQMREAGLSVREDAIGNIFGRWEGGEKTLPPVATGSHIDAVPFSGRYDGSIGVLGALEAVRSLKESGFEPRRSIELIMFSAEEPTRFGIGCLGSRALSGCLDSDNLKALRDSQNRSLDDIRREAGYQSDLASVPLPQGAYEGFIELHIEQGPLLEGAGIPIGLVTSIAAPATLRVTLKGEGGHAGAVLMAKRRDALVAASEVILAVEKAAASTGRVDSVATVGLLKVHPGAVNSIPSRVTMEIDIRDTSQAPRDGMLAHIKAAVAAIAADRDIEAEIELLNADPPSRSGELPLSALTVACGHLHLPYLKMTSRAYHDTLFMSLLCPTAMIFVPSRGGFSHRPDEYTAPEQIVKGVEVLALALARLAGEKNHE